MFSRQALIMSSANEFFEIKNYLRSSLNTNILYSLHSQMIHTQLLGKLHKLFPFITSKFANRYFMIENKTILNHTFKKHKTFFLFRVCVECRPQ